VTEAPRRSPSWGLLAALLLLVPVVTTPYTVDAREVAVVTLFGRPVRNLVEPGLYLRAPWPLHQVTRYDRRARLLDVDPTEVLTKDKKNLVVETFVVWRVADAERFLSTVGTPEAAETQLSDLVVSRVAASFGERDFSLLMSTDAAQALIPPALPTDVAAVAQERLGIDVLDVRVRHVGLPVQNEQSIYERMRAERLRIANAYRSEGEEKAATIRAQADRQAAELLAQADRDAAEVRAKAEEQAARTYAETAAMDPELYLFLRRLEAAEAVLDDDATLVVPHGTLLAPLLEGDR
jgi:modulator of FtsH protease HflC